MTIPRPGISYTETASQIAVTVESDEILCFVVQTSTAIASIDNQLVLFDNLDAFNTVATGKGLTKTIEFMNNVLSRTGQSQFYVYSVKTDTTAGFTEAVTCSNNRKEIHKIIFFEENASAQANDVKAKMNALASACHTSSGLGAFRVAIVVPYASYNTAVAAVENSTPAEAAVTGMTSVVGAADGRLYVFLPNFYSEMVGQTISTEVGVEPGYGYINDISGTPIEFTPTQMDTLRNAGVNFLETEREFGQANYRIHLGVTTNAVNTKSDSLIVAREINDALLREIDSELQPLIKAKETEENVVLAQTIVKGIIAGFVADRNVTSDTALTVSVKDRFTFQIVGNIVPTQTLIKMEVNTTIQ